MGWFVGIKVFDEVWICGQVVCFAGKMGSAARADSGDPCGTTLNWLLGTLQTHYWIQSRRPIKYRITLHPQAVSPVAIKLNKISDRFTLP